MVVFKILIKNNDILNKIIISNVPIINVLYGGFKLNIKIRRIPNNIYQICQYNL
ncbi:protein of unknown function [Methanocaldococcus lauensis]|uniref:Uncharacterized protein n=1 Tax=Methanocaldococcus lauensis TaxID=2546128 RepID=A0A8D6PY32_9EURY|nr:protein of unknown function [Methanocaldococcus lauensis]